MAGCSSSSAVLLASLVCAAGLFGAGEASGAAHRVVDPEWHPATATWYGSAEGDGSDGETSHASSILTCILHSGFCDDNPSRRRIISNGECPSALQLRLHPNLCSIFLSCCKTDSEQ